jgi:tetratricopeptide (TPR) repeat protein
LLKRAIALNPFDSASWIQLGLLSEFDRGDLQTAEHYYLKAATVDHMFLPKWTLTNFYFRGQNETKFFQWVKEALAITPYAPDPAFTEMWQMAQDPAKIAAALPDRPRVLLQYASFLSRTNRPRSIPAVVQRLIRAVGPGDPHAWGRDDLLAGIEDRLLAAGDLDAALRVWANMSDAGWIHENLPTSAHPLTNGDFNRRPYGHGFDWVISSVNGIIIDQFSPQKELRLNFSGQQPDKCELLRQYIPVEPGGDYLMEWKTLADQIENPSGLMWHMRCAGESACPSLESGDLLGGSDGIWRFRAPDSRLCVLTLDYARPTGAVMANGTVTLSSVSMFRQTTDNSSLELKH